MKFIVKSIGFYLPFLQKYTKRLISLTELYELNYLFKSENKILYPISNKSKIYLEKNNYLSDLILKDFEFEERYLMALLLDVKGHFLDIGANIGLYSILAAEIIKDGNIYSFEPAKDIAHKLKTNIQVNKIKNVQIIQAAVCDKNNQTIPIYINNNGYDAFNSIVQPISDTFRTEYTDTVSLDFFIKDKNIDIRDIQFVKIDTEGAEYSILKGAANILEHGKHIIYMIEFNTDYQIENTNSNNVYNITKLYQYTCFKYYNDKKSLINVELNEQTYPNNFFLIHQTQIGNIKYKLSKYKIKLIS